MFVREIDRKTQAVSSSLSSQLMIHTHKPANPIVDKMRKNHWLRVKPTSRAAKNRIITMPTAKKSHDANFGCVFAHVRNFESMARF
jgi:hypothetical protein